MEQRFYGWSTTGSGMVQCQSLGLGAGAPALPGLGHGQVTSHAVARCQGDQHFKRFHYLLVFQKNNHIHTLKLDYLHILCIHSFVGF